jgi:hypothetical protein
LAKFRITNTTETYNAFTDERLLALVLEEGLDPEHLQYKDQLIDYFTSITDRFTAEHLQMALCTGDIRVKKCNTCPILDSLISTV